MKKRNLYGLYLFMVFATQFAIQAQSGGTYNLSHSVIASGGGTSTGGAGGAFKVEGTVGQPTAGTNSNGTSLTNNQYALRGGFWAFQQMLAPTSAQVEVGGRVTTANGNGIRNVRITMTDAQGNPRTVLSGSFGYYRFNDVSVGETYIFSIAAKKYTFSQSVLVRNINEFTNDINFVGDN